MAGGYPDVPGPASTIVVLGRSAPSQRSERGPIDRVSVHRRCGQRRPPPAESISPTAGGPRSVFTVLLAATAGERVDPAPKAWLSDRRSAGHGIYHTGKPAWHHGMFLPGNQGVDPCLPPTSVRVWPVKTIHHAGTLVFVYRVAPQRFHLKPGARAATSSVSRRSKPPPARSMPRPPTPARAGRRPTSRSASAALKAS